MLHGLVSMPYLGVLDLDYIIANIGLNDQAPVVGRVDRAIHYINHYPLGNSIDFASVYPLDSDLSGG